MIWPCASPVAAKLRYALGMTDVEPLSFLLEAIWKVKSRQSQKVSSSVNIKITVCARDVSECLSLTCFCYLNRFFRF